MNNIEILENKLKLNEKTKFDWFGEKEFEAIENLIQENKELKEKQKEYEKQLDLDYVEENYIPKSKVKAKIEEKIKEGNYRTIDNPSGRIHFQKEITDYQIEVLQELLGENQ